MNEIEVYTFEQDFDEFDTFIGLGRIEIPSGGPCCYFTIQWA